MSVVFILFATTIFIASNIDTLLVLMALFCVASFQRRAVVLGQFLSCLLLILISLAGARLALLIPSSWIGLIGVIPLGIGVKKLRETRGTTPVDPCEGPAAATGKVNPSGVLSVTVLMLCNGGDNLSIYIPVFAAHSFSSILGMSGIFLVMSALWCGIAYFLSTRRYIGGPIRRHGRQLLPWLMIVLGLYILSGPLLLLL